MMMNNVEMLDTVKDFDALIEKANTIQSMCTDYKVPASSIRMTDKCNLKFGEEELPLSRLATGHLCGKLSVPSRYFTRLVDAHQEALAAANINCWLENDKRNLFLRGYAGMIRGVLSGSYSVYDAPEILTTVREVFDPQHFVLKGSFVNHERLHLRLVQKEMLDVEGEDLYAGITLDSSDVGRSGLSVKFFIWKQICTNGLTISKSAAKMFKQKHIGINHDDFVEGLTIGLNSFYNLKDKVAESINETRKIPVDSDLEKLMEEVKNATNLSDQATEKVIQLMQVKYAPNKWGLINGITEVAQDYTLETRLQLEEIAGSMLVG